MALFLAAPAKADPWANSIVDYGNLGAGEPENALGHPYPGGVPSNWQDFAVRINPGGYLILDMGEGEEIFDLAGSDFYVEEVDKEDGSSWGSDPYHVFASVDLEQWHYIGRGTGDTQFDLSDILPRARYLKIEGIETDSEIDGVEILPHIPSGWLKGNTHTHSNLSDGDSSPDEVAARYLELGYDFLVLTDHNVVSDFSQYSTQDYLCIDGEEITDSTNHTNGIDLIASISPSTLEDNVDEVLAQGGIPHINHPSYSGLDAANIIPIDGLFHMEVFNALTNDYDEDIWDRVLASGKLVYGIASDDCHRLSSQAGRGWIVVRSDNLDLQSIKDAVNAGDYYASSGIVLNDYYVDSEQMIVDSQNGTLIEFIGPVGQILDSVEGPYGFYRFTGTDGLFNPLEFYVRARISNASGRYAWTQPRFTADPYADAVINHSGMSTGSTYHALGIPHEGKVPSNWARYGVRIPAGGFLLLDLGEDEEIQDREGDDLYVEEIDSEDGVGSDDPYHVYASADMFNWVHLGQESGDAYFDLAGMLGKARYIKLEVATSHAEIDGVEANFIDAFADRVVDFDGMSAGYPRYVVGPPSPGPIPAPWDNYAVRIDAGGFLDLDLGPDEEVADGPGDDIYIEEVDLEDGASFANNAYTVKGSQDYDTWTPLGTGTGDGSFDLQGRMDWLRYLRLEPINSAIEIDGIRVESVGINWCKGDYEPDGDVDGNDLAFQAAGGTGINLKNFAQHFGRENCP